MEVEMKAKVSIEDVEKFFNTKYQGVVPEPEFFHKDDVYYSFNGDVVINPKASVRIRRECQLNPAYYSIRQVLLDDINFHENPVVAHDTVLTVKRKCVDDDGVETNKETEGSLCTKALFALYEVFEATNFKEYFSKTKRSVSTVVIGPYGIQLHVEFVTVNGIGPYCEVEAIVDEDKVEEATKAIKMFFISTFNISEFEERSYGALLNEEN